jgi:hypothetical protein
MLSPYETLQINCYVYFVSTISRHFQYSAHGCVTWQVAVIHRLSPERDIFRGFRCFILHFHNFLGNISTFLKYLWRQNLALSVVPIIQVPTIIVKYLAIPFRIRKVPGSNVFPETGYCDWNFPETGYCDWNFSGFSFVLWGKLCVWSVYLRIGYNRLFRNIFPFIIQTQPTIRRYTSITFEKASLNKPGFSQVRTWPTKKLYPLVVHTLSRSSVS